MAQNFCMTINLMAFIGSKVIEVEDENGVLEEGVFLSTGCNFGASIHAHKYAYCGIASTIMTGLHELGEDCLIGAGAVVIRDVEPEAVMAGVPAKVIKYKNVDKSLLRG